jgi:hypothetical protein
LRLARFRPHLLLALALAMTLAVLAQPPIHQPQAYHAFADTRTILGIPNFWNVVSNLPFVFVGLAGLRWVLANLQSIERALRPAHVVLFIGVTLVGFGSGWYHLRPDNAALVWDRLPMTLAFMAFFAIVLGEHIALRLGRLLLWPLLVAGVLSVLYWRASDDLRPYALVQFLPVLLIPLVLWLYPREGSGAVWLALGCYVLAKLLEQFDPAVHAALGNAISGHSLKHLAAAAGMYALLAGWRRRDRRSAGVHATAPVAN